MKRDYFGDDQLDNATDSATDRDEKIEVRRKKKKTIKDSDAIVGDKTIVISSKEGMIGSQG